MPKKCLDDSLHVNITDFYKDEGSISYPGILVFNGSRVRLAYDDDDDETVAFEGEEVQPGSWLLHCPSAHGKASLHSSPIDCKTYEGSFIVQGVEGMWQVVVEEH